jgi:ABC-type multidrug transport system fused ATPase/permease subunit
VQHADKIVVLKEGKIEAIGQHKELLKTSPLYLALNANQDSNVSSFSASDPGDQSK